MNTSVRARHDARGFSFIELLVTIIIAGIAFAAMVPVFVQGAKATSADKARNLAKSIAQDRIEKIRQLPYNLITENNLKSTVNLPAVAPPTLPNYPAWKWADYFGPTATTNNEGGSTKYDVTYSVVFVGGTSPGTAGTARTYSSTGDGTEDYLKVAVSVTWTGNPRPARTVILQTLVFRQNDGPQVTGLDVLSVSGINSTTGWLTHSTETDAITFSAVIGPGDASLVTLVKFSVTGPNGYSRTLANGELDTSGISVAYTTTWAWSSPPVVDGTYTVNATAYSSATGYGVYAGNTWSRTLQVETGDPVRCANVWALGGDHEVMLSWTPSTSADVATYDIYRAPATDLSGSTAVRIGSFSGQAGSVASGMPPVFMDWGSTGAGPPDGDMGTPTSPATSYNYWVVPRDQLGNPARPTGPGLPTTGGTTSASVPLSPTLGATVSVTDTTPPSPLSSVSLTSEVTNQLIKVNWGQDSLDNPPSTVPTVGGTSVTPGALGGYLVFRDGDLREPYGMTLLKTTSWSDLGLGWAETHSYSLRAFDGSLNMSSLAGPITATTALSPTYTFKLTTNSACTVTVTNTSSQDNLPGWPNAMSAGIPVSWVVTPGDYAVKAVSPSTTRYRTFSVTASDLLDATISF